MNHIRITDAMLAQAISLLQKTHTGEMKGAQAELSKLWGSHVGDSTLGHAFKLRGLDPPSTYLLPRRSAAQRLAASLAGGVSAARHVGDPGGVSDRGGARIADALIGAVAPGQYRRGDRVIGGAIPCSQSPRNPGQVEGVSSTRGQAGEDDNPRTNPELHCPRAPKGYHLRGVSTMVDGAGNVSAQWIKTTQDAASINAELMLDAIKTLAEPLHGSHDPTPAQPHLDSDLLCVYKVPDPHLGMFGWREEVGKDYDVKIAEALHLKAIRQLAQISPPAKHALVLALGDFFHSDSNLARTSRSGNPLDTDSRFAKVLRIGVAMARAMVDCALAKHEHVTTIVEVGNHDDLSSIMLATALSLIYERDPRVTVDTSPARFHWYRFGRCLIGSTHGSETKPEQLPMIMAHDRPEDWGATEHRQFYVGHWHHEAIKEYPGVTVEYCRTLAGLDAWASGKGFRSARGMRCDIWHREHGLVSFNQIGLGQLEAA